ncbi:unannotated protein [freshwater metagenome]|uniref:Unannotated protein n=1 Tax=freshwater metagenome TaxID=449393 RepID=A0A6J7I8V0_9ZZZZ
MIEVLCVVGAALLVLAAVNPATLFVNALPVGTDLTGHVVGMWLIRENPGVMLPGGWTDTAFMGFPIFTFYPWLPSLLGVLISAVTTLPVAAKLVTVLPLVLLPAAAWAGARLASLPRGVAALMAVATVPFMFDVTCSRCGGSVVSTLNGEYSYAWGLAFGLVALGLTTRLLATGAGAVATALVVSAAGLSHPIPGLWTAGGVIVLLGLMRHLWLPRWRRVAVTGASALLLCLVWWLPFLAYRDWMPNLNWAKQTDYVSWLLPLGIIGSALVLALAVAAAVDARTRSWWAPQGLAIVTVSSGVLFVVLGGGLGQYNDRLYPLWALGLWLMAGAGVWSLARRLVAAPRPGRATIARGLIPLALLLVVALSVGTRWGWWGVSSPPQGVADGVGLGGVSVTGFGAATRDWGRGALVRDDAAELSDVADVLINTASTSGCGRVVMNRGDGQSPVLGEPNLHWLAPVLTNGCLTSTMTAQIHASDSVAAMVGLESLVSDGAVRGVPPEADFGPNLAVGVQWMRQLGVRYLLLHGRDQVDAAASVPGLKPGAVAGSWVMAELEGVSLVTAPANLPLVVDPPVPNSRWEELTRTFAQTDDNEKVTLVQDGATTWPRTSPPAVPQEVPAKAVAVSQVRATGDSVSFRVDTVDLPVVVAVSDFPGWTVASGAADLYRGSPNVLVVVPHTNEVTISRSRTVVDWLAIVLGALGLVLLVVLGVKGRGRR